MPHLVHWSQLGLSSARKSKGTINHRILNMETGLLQSLYCTAKETET